MLAILLALLLTMTLVACASAPEPENLAASIPTEMREPEQTSEPNKMPEPESAPEPDDTSHSGILLESQREGPTDVRAYHVMDDLFNQPEFVSYEVIDLNSFDFYHEFVDSYEELLGSEDVPYRIVFMTDTPVKDFCYLAIETATVDDGLGITVKDTLYRLDSLTPEEPFVVNWTSIGDSSMFRGFSYVDEGGFIRTFGFNVSGEDGDLYLIEFEPE